MALDRGNLATLDSTWYHGWCKECYHVKPAVEKVRLKARQSLLSSHVTVLCTRDRCCAHAHRLHRIQWVLCHLTASVL